MKKNLLVFLFLTTGFLSKGQTHSITFETPDSLLTIDNTPGNIWQIGQPHKMFFDTAFGGLNVIATGLNNPYPVNNTSSFTIKLPGNWGAGDGLDFFFWHKYDTYASNDGGYIETSLNDSDWFGLYNFGSLFGADNMYLATDTILGGIPAFSGNSGNWVYSNINSCLQSVSPVNVIYLRFTFKSAPVDMGKEGWMIDDINWDQLSCDAVNNINEPHTPLAISPNPTSDELVISSYPPSASQLLITDVLGRVIYRQAVSSRKTSIDISGLSKGLFFVVLKTSDGGEMIRKFVKE